MVCYAIPESAQRVKPPVHPRAFLTALGPKGFVDDCAPKGGIVAGASEAYPK
ncbi:hypothetical protein MesoLj131a_02910 [Mesorhizobium sp. 131-2-1]|nr:hypothetical protein MesoLj131a_02910 [Mesorhizobium sp. 131-2-1]